MLLTIVICTFKRDELLAITLATLGEQTVGGDRYRVLVVDNAGSESTREVTARAGADYIDEPIIGLSIARNRGAQVSRTPWILYLDDDVRAPPDLVARFLARLEVADYAALGGAVRPWFKTSPPEWVLKYYDKVTRPGGAARFGELPDEKYLVGCLFAIEKAAWEEVGGFSATLGMQGNRVGRAEENEFQLRLRRAGHLVFYDPDIYIDHLVQPYKYSINGSLKLAYASGRDGIGMQGQVPLTVKSLLAGFASITFYSLPFNTGRLLLKSNYYWQNFIVDTLSKYYFAWAQFRSK